MLTNTRKETSCTQLIFHTVRNYNLTDGVEEDKHGTDNANKHAMHNSRVHTLDFTRRPSAAADARLNS